MALLDVKNVRKVYTTRFGGNQVEALKDVNFSVEQSEYVAIMGESGSGKSTLLNILAALDKPTEGKVFLKEKDLSKVKEKEMAAFRRNNLGFVFQDFQLLTDRTVYNNLEFVLRATGWKNKREIQERIEEVLDLVGMSNKGYKLPNELSGGEQQRIVIARAVLNSPAIILADEPTGNLDVETGKSIVELLHNICESGSSVVMTTHNLQLLKEYPGSVYRCSEHRITDVTDEYMPRQRTIEIDLNIDN